MNHLIVFGHPNPQSFGAGIVETIKKASEEKGASVKVRSLYEIGFNPVLKPSDFEALQSGNIPADIEAEQEEIKWADVVTFVYPVWWAGLPAILKGYVDRVFSYGFAYEYVDGIPNGLLKGKKALLFTTHGAGADYYESNGMHNAMKQTSDEGIFKFCGFEVIKHSFYGAVPHVDDATRQDYLKDVENTIKASL